MTSATLLAQPLYAQNSSSDGVWSDVVPGSTAARGERQIIPQKYRTVRLDLAAFQARLAQAPRENTSAARNAPLLFSLPLPDGAFGRFQVVEAPVMAPELAARFPEIKTYAGQGVDDPTAIVRFDWTPAGFHALIISATGSVYIDPYQRNDTTTYISYWKRDFIAPATKQFAEQPPLVTDAKRADAVARLVAQGAPRSSGTQLRTYRLAVAATGEYTQFHGGTVAQALAAIVTTVNRVTGIYEREVAVRLILVADNDAILYTNPSTDPYTNNNPSALLDQNQTTIDSVIGNANYDVGHVFSTGGGGLAYLGVPCVTGWKALGETGSSSPVGDPFDVDYVAHELGHQFGANHTFNGNIGSCSGNRNASTAYEPGSGSTIMGYAGICGSQNLQPNSDDDFHTVSFDEIVVYTTQGDGNSCPVVTATGNTPPTAEAGPSYTIPRQTLFTLTGSATDADNNPLTYEWEEFNLGSAGNSSSTNPPFFRSFLATTSPSRTFPQWSDIVNNTTTIGEVLPSATRTMTFRFIVRDNRIGGGGVNYDSTTINILGTAGPFQVTAPNTAVTWAGGSTQSVTWTVAGTDADPIHCANVDIRLSTDGGHTYPTLLASGVPNNGSATIPVPFQATTSARVQVLCANNIFFDISNVNFTITAAVTPTPTATATTMATATGTATAMPTPTPTPTATATETTVPSATPPATASATATATATAIVKATETATPTLTATIVISNTTVVYVSSTSSGTVDDVAFSAEDILVYDRAADRWLLLFDGSDVGLGNVDVNAFTFLDDSTFLLSFNKPLAIPGLGNIDDSDVVRFTPTQLGNKTSGQYSFFLDGSDVGLSTRGETIDALSMLSDGRLLISVAGTATVTGVTAQDEDLLVFTPTSWGAASAGTWDLFFDGSDIALTQGSEDVDGAWWDAGNSRLALSTKGDFAVVSLTTLDGDNNDIFGCTVGNLDGETSCRVSSLFNGDTVRFTSSLDGIAGATDAVVDTLASMIQNVAQTPDGREQFPLGTDEISNEPASVDEELDQFDITENAIFLPIITQR
ncbi:MAG: M12 family metallo-peptidase [Caldilineaceae bacterium]